MGARAQVVGGDRVLSSGGDGREGGLDLLLTPLHAARLLPTPSCPPRCCTRCCALCSRLRVVSLARRSAYVPLLLGAAPPTAAPGRACGPKKCPSSSLTAGPCFVLITAGIFITAARAATRGSHRSCRSGRASSDARNHRAAPGIGAVVGHRGGIRQQRRRASSVGGGLRLLSCSWRWRPRDLKGCRRVLRLPGRNHLLQVTVAGRSRRPESGPMPEAVGPLDRWVGPSAKGPLRRPADVNRGQAATETFMHTCRTFHQSPIAIIRPAAWRSFACCLGLSAARRMAARPGR